MTTYASDTFDRANNASSLGNSDGPGTPSWGSSTTHGIISNLAYVSSASTNTYHTAYLPVAQADVTVSCNIFTSSTNNRLFAGLALRFADENNFIKVLLLKAEGGSNNSIILRNNVAGSNTELATVSSAGLANGTTYNLKAVISGTTCAVYLDGVQRIAPTTFNSGLTTQNYGIASYNGSSDYDDKQSFWIDFLVDDSLNTPAFTGYTRPQQSVYRM